MAYEIIWSPEATEDLQSIVEYLSRSSPRYASTVAESLLEAADKLAHLPFAGRVVPELEDTMIREKFVHNYRLIYQIHDESITIIAIIHVRRLLPLEKE